jgi:hypothetical protein
VSSRHPRLFAGRPVVSGGLTTPEERTFTKASSEPRFKLGTSVATGSANTDFRRSAPTRRRPRGSSSGDNSQRRLKGGFYIQICGV